MSMMPPPNHKQEKKSNNLHVEEVIVSQRHPLYVVLSFSETDYHSQFYSKLLPKQVRKRQAQQSGTRRLRVNMITSRKWLHISELTVTAN